MKSSGFRGWLLFGAAALAICWIVVAALSAPAHADGELEERKLPMRFTWVACQPRCRGWINAVGIVTADTPRDFDEFARDRNLSGTTVVLDSSGGSVNDAITLGRRWREIGLMTTVGSSISIDTSAGERNIVASTAYCESMCAFLLLSGKVRYVPDGAHVRVHQIWMGDRADDPKASNYSAQDMMIVERDIGRLAKFTFDMGGSGDLLSLALNVPPWEELHELSPQELRLTNLITTDAIAEVLPQDEGQDLHQDRATAALNPKPMQDRFVGNAGVDDKNPDDKNPLTTKPTKTAEVIAPTGGASVVTPVSQQR